MSCRKRMPIFELLLLPIVSLWLAGCGVKGDPLPPERPAEIGRGRPTYQQATEEIMKTTPHPPKAKENPKNDDSDE
jgi:hypothetical protein